MTHFASWQELLVAARSFFSQQSFCSAGIALSCEQYHYVCPAARASEAFLIRLLLILARFKAAAEMARIGGAQKQLLRARGRRKLQPLHAGDKTHPSQSKPIWGPDFGNQHGLELSKAQAAWGRSGAVGWGSRGGSRRHRLHRWLCPRSYPSLGMRSQQGRSRLPGTYPLHHEAFPT